MISLMHTVDLLCSKAVEIVTTSRTIRGEIKPLVVSVQASKSEAHGKICTAISKNVEHARIQKVFHSMVGNQSRGLPCNMQKMCNRT